MKFWKDCWENLKKVPTQQENSAKIIGELYSHFEF